MFSFFSRSSSKGRYRNPNQGGQHYQRGGILGGILGSFMSSMSMSRAPYYPPGGQPGAPYYPPGGQPAAPYYPPGGQPAAPQPMQAGSICPGCGAGVPAGSRFCLSCGGKMGGGAFCAGCGKPLPPGAKFCPGCGAPSRA